MNDGSTSQGTGFINYNDQVITDYHNVRNAKNIVCYDYMGTKYENISLESCNKPVDVVCLRVPGVKVQHATWFVVDSDWEQIGESVYVLSSPQGMAQTFTSEMLSGWRANGALFQFSAPTTHGGSGSPIFNAYGPLIGMAKSMVEGNGDINFAISMNAIYDALNLTDIEHPKGFHTGITKGLELRIDEQIAFDESNKRAR